MAVYVLSATQPWTVAADGTVQPAGTISNRILWDGVTQWQPPAGFQALPDNGRAIYQPNPNASQSAQVVL